MALGLSKELRQKHGTTYALGESRGAEKRSGKHDCNIEREREEDRKEWSGKRFRRELGEQEQEEEDRESGWSLFLSLNRSLIG